MASDLTKYPGLTSAEVTQRIARGESNNYKVRVDRTYWQIVRDNVFNIFNFILFTLVIILVPFREYLSILFASISVVLNSVIGMVQEIRAKQSLDKLAALNAQTVNVVRDGKEIAISIDQVVKDDILPLTPGDKVVVDGKVLVADSLEMDESLLTGESDAVQKEVGSEICSGSFCTAGSGLFVATEVGANSTVNQLSRTAKAYKNVQTPTQKKVAVFVEIVLVFIVFFGPMITIAGFVTNLPIPEIVKNTLVLVTSSVPQGLLLATTLSLTLGAVSISRYKTLIQRINAVESLANVNVLCFDKTGTLTRNELAVTKLIPLNNLSHDEVCHLLAEYVGNLAHQNKTALAIAGYVHADKPSQTKVQEIPFTSARKWGAVAFQDHTLVLGAPERVLNRDKDIDAMATYSKLSQEGQRVVALARMPHAPHENTLTESREALALIVMSDQLREDIQQTLNAFYEQNVELKVISGDNAETVSAIATDAGMRVTSAYMGEDLEKLSSDDFDKAVLKANVFARIEPETKRKIIASLRKQGAYVAMVGDGVNDVPALKEAELAIVMNDGTQISKDVADIVLLNNAMSTLPLAFVEGKQITQKIFGTAKMFLAKNVFHVLTFILVSFMALPFPINPIQISWMVFGTVNIPSLLLAFGWLKPREMRHFGKDVMRYVAASGVVGGMTMTIVYTVVYLGTGRNLAIARTALTVFMSLFGFIVYLNVHGVEFSHPRTAIKNSRAALLSIPLILITVVMPFYFPNVFAFVPLPLPIALFMGIMLVVAIVALHFARAQTSILKQIRLLAES